MEIYVNNAGRSLKIKGVLNIGNSIVTFPLGNKYTTGTLNKTELNSLLYNGCYRLIKTHRRTLPYERIGRTPQLCLSDFGGKEVAFTRDGQIYTGWLIGYDADNETFVVRTTAEWGYRLTELNPNVMYVKGQTALNCRTADVPYNDIIFLL